MSKTKACCRKAFRLAIQQVLRLIKENKLITVEEIRGGLECAFKLLEEDEEKC